MRFGVRSRLFAVSVALILSVGLTTGLYLESELRAWLEHRIENELARQAAAAGEAMQYLPGPLEARAVDPLADRLGRAFDSRVTVIASSGIVLGDSEVDAEALANLENHQDRPEVVQAREEGRGQSRRHSTTVHMDMLYVASTYEEPEPGVVRVARSLSEVDAAIARLRTALLVAGAVGLFIAVFMSGLASHLMSRTLRQLSKSAHAIANRERDERDARAETRPRLDAARSDELGGLAGSINRMADDIEATIAALGSERTRFEAVLEGMSEAVIAIDGERRIELMNTAARELFGLDETPAGELLVQYLRTPAMDQLLAQPIEPRSQEFDLPKQRERRMLARVNPERGGAGCIIVMHDVTDIRRLTTMRRDFVANVSHELRTPVSVIQANAETLLEGAAGDPVHGPRLLGALHRNAVRLSRIISDLLVLSRVESGHQAIELQSLDLARAARRAFDAVEATAREREIDVAIEVDADMKVCADESALDHILVNYLDNAIKYTQVGGQVRVRARALGERVRIEVVDNGPGIPGHLADRVFERFFRVDAGRSRDMGGTGLGLAIVKHLAHAMDGEVGVAHAAPHGSCFFLTLARG